MTAAAPFWDAVIVAGGQGSRLGGIDKSTLVFEGRTLLRRSLDAVRSAARVSIVGYPGMIESTPGMSRTTERPQWSGPAAAIIAGLANLRDSDSEFTAVIPVDMPRVAEALNILINQLARAADSEGLIAVDASGHRQPLLAIYRSEALRGAAATLPTAENAAVRTLISSLRMTEVLLPSELTADVDTPADAERLRIRLPSRSTTSAAG